MGLGVLGECEDGDVDVAVPRSGVAAPGELRDAGRDDADDEGGETVSVLVARVGVMAVVPGDDGEADASLLTVAVRGDCGSGGVGGGDVGDVGDDVPAGSNTAVAPMAPHMAR